MSDRTKVSLGIVLLVLLIAAPLSAASVSEAETPTPAATLESFGTMVCEIIINEAGEVQTFCPDGFADDAAEAAENDCFSRGGYAVDISVSCFYLGGGYWRYRLEYGCEGVR